MLTRWCLNLLFDIEFVWFHVLHTFFFVIFCKEFHSVNMAQRKGDTVNNESEKQNDV